MQTQRGSDHAPDTQLEGMQGLRARGAVAASCESEDALQVRKFDTGESDSRKHGRHHKRGPVASHQVGGADSSNAKNGIGTGSGRAESIHVTTPKNGSRDGGERRDVRQEKTRPLIVALEPWLREKLALNSQKTKLAEAIRYALSRWEGLTRFVDDGRIEIDSNVVERAIRPIALNRKNALFAGSDGGGEHWATIASLIETCKLNGIDPQAYLADALTKIINDHPNSQIDELMPWAYTAQETLQDVA